MVVGNAVGLKAYMWHETPGPIPTSGGRLTAGASNADNISHALLHITLPNGSIVHTNMYDDGLHGDDEPNDGIFAGAVTAVLAGSYRMQSLMMGSIGGVNFMRSSEHLIEVN